LEGEIYPQVKNRCPRYTDGKTYCTTKRDCYDTRLQQWISDVSMVLSSLWLWPRSWTLTIVVLLAGAGPQPADIFGGAQNNCILMYLPRKYPCFSKFRGGNCPIPPGCVPM